MLGAAVVAAVALSPARAGAEEGLFVTRLVGGASTVRPQMPDRGGAIAGGASMWLRERAGVLASAEYLWHDAGNTLSLGLAATYLPYQGEWSRLYVYAGPAASRARRSEDAGGVAYDLSGQAGAGFEYLLMWGLGVSLELRATAPLGWGDREAFDGAAVALGAGLFTEF